MTDNRHRETKGDTLVASLIVKCRTCGSFKGRTDICPVCCARKPEQTLRVRNGQPVSLMRAHFFHATAVVGTKVARGDNR